MKRNLANETVVDFYENLFVTLDVKEGDGWTPRWFLASTGALVEDAELILHLNVLAALDEVAWDGKLDSIIYIDTDAQNDQSPQTLKEK